MNEIAITGIGIVSPIGIGIEAFAQSLRDGSSGVGLRPGFENATSPLRIAAMIKDFDGKKYVKPRKSMKVMCRPIQYGFAASTMALEQAKVSEADFDPDRKGTIFGSEAFYANPQEVADVFRKCVVNQCYDHDQWGSLAMREIEPLWMLKYLPNMVASHVSISFDARGPSNSICQSEVSGSLATIEAIDLIQRGDTDVVVAGGTGSPMDFTGLLYRGIHKSSLRIDDPELACRPFDRDRDGIVAGEGAGVLVLEDAAKAKQRGAEILATVVAYSRTFCTNTQDCFSESIAHSIRITLDKAGWTVNDVGHVNANGLSTVREDRIEALAIQKTLGDVLVFAPKSYYGYVGPGADIIDLSASVLSVGEGFLPATLNFNSPDPDAPLNVNADYREFQNPNFLSIGFSATGQITCMAVRVG